MEINKDLIVENKQYSLGGLCDITNVNANNITNLTRAIQVSNRNGSYITPNQNNAAVVWYDRIDCQVGNGLTLDSNGRVKIDSDDIHTIEVTATTWVERGNDSYAWGHLTKNGNDIAAGMIPASTGGEVWQSSILSGITGVQRGDILYPYFYFSNTNSSNRIPLFYGATVTMTVRVIN